MKKIATTVMMMMITGVVMAEGISASVSLDAASAYVFRGATFNDGFVLQPGAEIGMGDLSVGVWANYDVDDYDGALKKNEFSEVDIYGSYSLPVELMDMALEYCAYTYPLDSTDADHEIGISAGIDAPLSPSVAIYYGLDGGIEDTLYVELGVGHDFEISDSVTAGLAVALGYVEPDEGEGGFSHADISGSISYEMVSASIGYVAELDDDVLAVDVEVYGSLGVGMDF